MERLTDTNLPRRSRDRCGIESDAIVVGDTVRLGDGTVVDNVMTNHLIAPEATVQGGVAPFDGPIEDPFCEVDAFGCGGPSVIVPPAGTTTINPGSYDRVKVNSGATLILNPGTYTFCSFRTSRNTTVEILGPGQSTIGVVRSFTLSNGSSFGAVGGAPTPILNVTGNKLRAGQASVLHAFVSAPNALLTVGRQGVVIGSFCAETLRTDKGITFDCEPPPTTSTTTTSTTTTSTTTTTLQTFCCDVPPGALGNPVPVCLDAVAPDVGVKCALLDGTLTPAGLRVRSRPRGVCPRAAGAADRLLLRVPGPGAAVSAPRRLLRRHHGPRVQVPAPARRAPGPSVRTAHGALRRLAVGGVPLADRRVVLKVSCLRWKSSLRRRQERQRAVTARSWRTAAAQFCARPIAGRVETAVQRGSGWSRLTRLPSVSVNETYCRTPGISIGSPST